MSLWLNECLRHLEDVATELRRTRFSYGGYPIRGEDLHRVQSLYTIWYAIIYENSTRFQRIEPRCLPVILRLLKETPVDQLLGVCKETYDLITQSYEVGFPANYTDFKHLLKREGFPTQFPGLLKAWIADCIGNPNAKTLKPLLDVLLFPTHLHLEVSSLEQDAAKSYCDLESEFQDDPTHWDDSITDIISRWFPREQDHTEWIIGKHGNGSTAPGYMPIAYKYADMSIDPLLQYQVNKIPRSSWDILYHPGLERTSSVRFVPKSFSKYRTIAMEPTSLMFWQQGVWNAFVSAIRRDQVADFGRRYRPETQGRNRAAALTGSVDGLIATLDLSSASDSVRFSQVKQWFRRTWLYPWLLATRSRQARLPDGTIIPLRKYASMGNATTFAVESIVFAAITETAIRRAGGNPMSSRYGVYGDDIFVEQRYAYEVMQALEENGFKPNKGKSFYLGATAFFRESCGVYAINGVDCTPLVCSRFYENIHNLTPKEPLRIAKAVDLANRMFLHDYQIVRAHIVRHLLMLPQHLRPPFGLVPGCVYSAQPDNHHLESRYSTRYQCREYRHGYLKGMRRGDRCGDAELYEFLRAAHLRDELGEPINPITTNRRGEVAWSSKWTTESSFLPEWDTHNCVSPITKTLDRLTDE